MRILLRFSLITSYTGGDHGLKKFLAGFLAVVYWHGNFSAFCPPPCTICTQFEMSCFEAMIRRSFPHLSASSMARTKMIAPNCCSMCAVWIVWRWRWKALQKNATLAYDKPTPSWFMWTNILSHSADNRGLVTGWSALVNPLAVRPRKPSFHFRWGSLEACLHRLSCSRSAFTIVCMHDVWLCMKWWMGFLSSGCEDLQRRSRIGWKLSDNFCQTFYLNEKLFVWIHVLQSLCIG